MDERFTLLSAGGWYKDGPFWRHPDSSNAGDLIFNSCYKIIQDVDVSPWALSALSACGLLLKERKRWPVRLNREDTAKTWIQWKWYKWGLGKKVYSRPRHIMTRDAYVAWITACVLTNNHYLVKSVTIPLHLTNPIYAPNTWWWRKRLIQDNQEEYAQRLDYLRALAVTFKFETP